MNKRSIKSKHKTKTSDRRGEAEHIFAQETGGSKSCTKYKKEEGKEKEWDFHYGTMFTCTSKCHFPACALPFNAMSDSLFSLMS